MIQDLVKQIGEGRTHKVLDLVKASRARTMDTMGGEDSKKVLWSVAFYGDVTAMSVLLENGWALTDLGPDLGLMGAVFHAHRKLCEFLIENGADVNFKDTHTGETPLHSAICKPNRPIFNPIVDLLLKNGADPNAKTIPGVETGAFMRDVRTKGETPLHRAAAFGDIRMIRSLISAGADKTAQDSAGDSPLSWASWHTRTGEILIELSFGKYKLDNSWKENSTSDHGWGGQNGMEVKFF